MNNTARIYKTIAISIWCVGAILSFMFGAAMGNMFNTSSSYSYYSSSRSSSFVMGVFFASTIASSSVFFFSGLSIYAQGETIQLLDNIDNNTKQLLDKVDNNTKQLLDNIDNNTKQLSENYAKPMVNITADSDTIAAQQQEADTAAIALEPKPEADAESGTQQSGFDYRPAPFAEPRMPQQGTAFPPYIPQTPLSTNLTPTTMQTEGNPYYKVEATQSGITPAIIPQVAQPPFPSAFGTAAPQPNASSASEVVTGLFEPATAEASSESNAVFVPRMNTAPAKYCRICGTKASDNDVYCGNCGTPLDT